MNDALTTYIERREAVLDVIRQILLDRLRVERELDELDPGTPLFGTGLGLDSVDAVELVVSVEAAFGVSLPDGEPARRALRTLDTLADFVLEHRREAA